MKEIKNLLSLFWDKTFNLSKLYLIRKILTADRLIMID